MSKLAEQLKDIFSENAIIGKNNIVAEVICDSINPWDDRLTTMRLHYPRFIHCFDGETEILTQINNEIPQFRSFEAVKLLNCKVAQYDKGKISFVYPTNYIENYSTHHTMVSLERKTFSLNVTDGHRVYTEKRTTNNKYVEDVIEAKELLGDYVGRRRIPQAGFMDYGQKLSNEEIALITWYVADGHEPKSGNCVVFHFRKKRKVERVTELLSKLNIEYVINQYEDDTVIKFEKPWWISKCYDGKNKVLPDELFNMDMEGYKHFKQACLESDGNVDNNEINTFSEKLAHQIQVIACLHNDAMNIRKYNGGCYKQKFQDKPYITFSKDKDTFENTSYSGKVYCVTVPSSFIVVRRKGIVTVSGNCEFLRHRMFSHSVSSSRAIPFIKMLEQVEQLPATPIYWGLNKPGMVAGKETHYKSEVEKEWLTIANNVAKEASRLNNHNLHKQVTNRILEPFQFVNI